MHLRPARVLEIVQNSNDAILSSTPAAAIVTWNRAAEVLFGYSAAEILGKAVSFLFPNDPDIEMHVQAESEHRPMPYETLVRRKNGENIEVFVTVSPVVDRFGRRTGPSIICRDITERKRTDRQLVQTQKLESLGVIAGGVAHDFNNLLVGILGNASLVLELLPESSLDREPLKIVVRAAEKASHLTRQLPAYADIGGPSHCVARIEVLARSLSASIDHPIVARI